MYENQLWPMAQSNVNLTYQKIPNFCQANNFSCIFGPFCFFLALQTPLVELEPAYLHLSTILLLDMAEFSKNDRSHIEHKIDFPDIFASCNETGSLVIVAVLLNLTFLFSVLITYY